MNLLMHKVTFTGISEDVPFSDDSGKITVGSNELKYSQKYTDGEKTIYVVKKR